MIATSLYWIFGMQNSNYDTFNILIFNIRIFNAKSKKNWEFAKHIEK